MKTSSWSRPVSSCSGMSSPGAFSTRRLYVRDGLVVQEWTATATHSRPMRRGDLVAEPSGKRVEWKGLDVMPFEDGLLKRKTVYSDSVSILRQIGLLQ